MSELRCDDDDDDDDDDLHRVFKTPGDPSGCIRQWFAVFFSLIKHWPFSFFIFFLYQSFFTYILLHLYNFHII